MTRAKKQPRSLTTSSAASAPGASDPTQSLPQHAEYVQSHGPLRLPTLDRLCPDSPTRPVSWRYQLASTIIRQRLDPGQVRADLQTRRVCRYLRCRWDDQSGRLPRVLASVAAAVHVQFQPDQARCAVLEARLLAGQAFGLIASLVQLPVPVVAAYESTLFNVTDRLGSDAYIRSQALDLDPSPSPDLNNVLRYVGYTGGPLVLDEVLHILGLSRYAASPPLVARPGEVPLSLHVRGRLAAWLVPFNAETRDSLSEIDELYQDLWRAGPRSPDYIGIMRRILESQVALLPRVFDEYRFQVYPVLRALLGR